VILERLKDFATYNTLIKNTRGKKNTAVFGMCQNQKPFVAAMMPEFCVYVASDFTKAKQIVQLLNGFSDEYAYLPPKDEVLVSNKGFSATSRGERSEVLFKMRHGLKGVVTTIEAMCQKYPFADSFFANVISIAKNDTFDIFQIVKTLVRAGYRQADQISAMGEFARKGDILDVYCPGYDNPVRIEFFGDDIDDIRIFDKMTKKSVQKIDRVDIVPLNQFFADDFDADMLKEQVFFSLSKQKLGANDRVRLDSVSEDAFLAIDNQDFSNTWLLPFVRHSVFAEYIPDNAVIIWDEPKQLMDKIKAIYDEHYQRMAYLLSKGEVVAESKDQLVDKNMMTKLYDNFAQIVFQGMATANTMFRTDVVANFKSTPLINYQRKIQLLCDDVRNWLTTGYRVVLYADGKERAEMLQKEISDQVLIGVTEKDVLPERGAIISPFGVQRGFVDHDNKLVLIGTFDIFSRQEQKKKIKKRSDKVFTTPEIGDYVVHEVHGIGLCHGIVSMENSFGKKDYIVVKYRDKETLYVPVDASNLLSKYSGAEKEPRLNKLGGNEFEKIKSKVKSNIKEMAFDLLKLYAARERARGFSYPADSYLEGEFAKAFPYSETEDQVKCIEEINKDLGGKKIMDRLVCGDVGYGKTEVALRAAFKVLASGKQVAFLSPTTILAEQHYQNACKRMEAFGFKIKSLNRFRSKQEQKLIIDGLSSGEVEMVCGTHRLLSKDVSFKDLGLLILDEEQRFGVEAKETIKNIKTNVDVLTLSATPIPRTLHMALTGMRDISIIQSPPKERLPVETYVVEGTDSLIADAISREVNRGGQVFVVYNRVETIDGFASKLKQLLPDVKFVVAHGQMKESDLEQKIYDFTTGKYDVLVSTTIIENGIDIPNANTLIVYDADCFGLSQLYQLRGRVGRSNRRAFAYFMYKENKVLTTDAYKRLNAVLEYTELGSGFKIAMRDLEIRGAGNIIGKEQHGHMEKVGYDMYCKLLAEAVAEIKGIREEKKIETEIDVAMEGSASGYINDSESRMAFYQRLANVCSEDDADELLDEITDIYGTPPKEVLNLIDISLLKHKASELGISEVTVRPGNVSICFFNIQKLQTEGVFAALEKHKNIARLDVTQKLAVIFDQGRDTVEKIFEKVFDFVSTACGKTR